MTETESMVVRVDRIIDKYERRSGWLILSIGANVILAFLVAVSVSKGCL